MKFVIAGLGSVGRRHLKNLLALGEREIVLLRTKPEALEDQEFSGLPVVTDISAALAYKPDAVIISNPTALHLGIALPAANAGCHLLIEKPISHSLEHVNELKDAVEKNGCRVLVGFQFRFHPTLYLCRQKTGNGDIGKPCSVRAHWGSYLPDWHPWEDYRSGYSARDDLGGGVLLTLCHPFDYLRWIFGDAKFLSAAASAADHLHLTVDSCAEVALRFENGVLGSIHLDYIQKPARHTVEIIGSTGTLSWCEADGALTLTDSNGAVQRWEPPNDFERNAMFVDEMRHFLAILRDNVAPICTLTDGIKTLEIALQARRHAGF